MSECNCPTCGEPLTRDPIYGRIPAPCENCCGGEDSDGEAWRADEAEAFARYEMDSIFRNLK
jgi:hypothetical protein